MGGPERVARHHESGRLTARERIDALVDPGTFYELGLLAEPELRREAPAPADAIVSGFARVDGRRVCILAVDATVLAGTTAQVNMRKQNRLAAFAGRKGLPLICLSDNDGGRIPDVMGWRFSGLPFDFRTFVQAPPGHPEIPRLAAVLGASYGDSALHAAMGDYVVMVPDAALALSGPPVVSAAIGEDLTHDELGGPAVAAGVSGSAHAVADDERAAFAALRRFLAFMPDSAAIPAPAAAPRPPATDPERLLKLVKADPRRGYDMRKVLDAIVDAESMLPWGERHGTSVICALARIEGDPVGVVASQPMQRGAVMDVPALSKEAAFIDLCDTFNIPLAFFQDVPGLMIGSEAERAGILAAYEGVVARLARAQVPKVAVIVRKAYGGGHFALGGRPTHPDLVLAWPTAELGFMAASTGVRTVHRRRLEETLAADGREAHDALVGRLAEEWARESEPWEAAAHAYIDDVIDPRSTREAVRLGIDFAWGSGPRVTKART
ncbi:MAG TPA: carboxyl transferase domain-containing protein [Miltoncostaeaceae bacterium]|nr:carboxyl transferase domain-containing protein [Miltoncostaeaceae bacterium]